MKEIASINIPTYNSEKTLEKCIKAAKAQTYKNIEILVIDSYSKDKTLEIAKKYGCKIVMCKGGLLEARILGAKKSKGKYILFLDSDQILHPTTIERAVKKIKKYDSLWLYERAYNRNKFFPSLYDADRKLVQKFLEEDVVLPRFFKKNLLLKAMQNIPKEIYETCKAHDHLIIWKEFKKISNKMGKVENAVEHIEPSNLIELFRKQFRWGKTTRDFYEKGFYRDLVATRNSFRKFHMKEPVLSTKSFILRILRGIPYKLGYWFG